MEKLVERCAGLDVHKDKLVACVRVPGQEGREQHIHEFETTTPELLALRDWLSRPTPGDAGGHGGDRGLLEAGLLPA